MIGPPGLRMPRDLIFGLSTLTRSKLCEHQAWLRHCTGYGRAYVRMLVAPPSGVRPPYPDAAPVDNLFKVLSSFSSFGISQHHVVRDLGGSMRRHVSFYRRMTRPHVQPSDLEHTTSPRLSVKVQARKADEHAKIARASQPVSCVGNTRVALFMNRDNTEAGILKQLSVATVIGGFFLLLQASPHLMTPISDTCI